VRAAHSRKAILTLGDSKLKQPLGGILYSKELLGLRSECPACGEWEQSTGWLVHRTGETFSLYVDSICTGCRSRGAVWRREWSPLIEEVLTKKLS